MLRLIARKIVPLRVRNNVQLYRQYRQIRRRASRPALVCTNDAHYRISLCTTCRDRLHHLRYTLRDNLRAIRSYPNAEVVVIDYGSRRPLDRWIRRNYGQDIEAGTLRYARVLNVSSWNASHAKNIAHNLAAGDIVVNVDPDNFIGNQFCEYINNLFLSSGPLQVVAQGDGNLSCAGRIALLRKHFQEHGGYDEALQSTGFGYEDYDLVRRLQAAGLSLIPIANESFLQTFWHSDEERSSGYEMGVHDVSKSSRSNYLRSSRNIDRGVLIANQGADWGKASILYGREGCQIGVSSEHPVR